VLNGQYLKKKQKDLMLNEQYLKKVFFFLSFFEPFLNIKNVNHEINQKKNSLHFNGQEKNYVGSPLDLRVQKKINEL
jgi:hypothetical protein